jgi:hypothetical protein
VTLALLAGAASAWAHDIEVCESGCDASTLEQAVSQSHDGDTIIVHPGEYADAQAVAIEHDLTISGAGAGTTVLRPGFDNANQDGAWITVADGATISLSDVTLDGLGRKVGVALRFTGSASGAIDRVTFRDISLQHPHLGIAVATNKSGKPDPATGNVDISNSRFERIQRVGVLYKGNVTGTFRDNVYVGKGEGDHLDYALDISAGAQVEVIGNHISGNRGVAATDGSTSAGILLSTFYGAGTSATITRNTLVDNTTGVAIGYNDEDTSAVTMRGNRIVGNTYGISSRVPSVDADDNWWGCNAGPGASGCDGVVGVDAPTRWTVMGLTADRPTIDVFDGTPVRADLTHNNAGEAIPGGGVPDGTDVAFATSMWNVQPSAATSDGAAAAMLSSDGTRGVGTVTATLDAGSASTDVTVPFPPPAPGPTPDAEPTPTPPPPAPPVTGEEQSVSPPAPSPATREQVRQARREARDTLSAPAKVDRAFDFGGQALVLVPTVGRKRDANTPVVRGSNVRFDRGSLRSGAPQSLMALSCPTVDCTATVTITFTYRDARGRVRTVTVPASQQDIAAGGVAAVTLNLPRAVRQQILRGRTVRMTVGIELDADGRSLGNQQRTLTLKTTQQPKRTRSGR